MLQRITWMFTLSGLMAGTLLIGCNGRYQAIAEYDCKAADNQCPSGFVCIANADGRHLCVDESRPEPEILVDVGEPEPEGSIDESGPTPETSFDHSGEANDSCEESVCDPCPRPCVARHMCSGGMWSCGCDCSGQEEDIVADDDPSATDEDPIASEDSEDSDDGQHSPENHSDDGEALIEDDGTDESHPESDPTCRAIGDIEPPAALCDRVIADYIECLPDEIAAQMDPECLEFLHEFCVETLHQHLRLLWCPEFSCQVKMSIMEVPARCVLPD